MASRYVNFSEILWDGSDNFYDFKLVKCMMLAEKILHEEKCYHICISEIDINQNSHDEFIIQKKYGKLIPIIYISKKQCLETGFKLREFGAIDVFSKPLSEQKLKKIVKKINNCFLNNLLLPYKYNIQDEVMLNCCNAIQKNFPDSIASWAASAGIDESYLRKKWKMWFDYHPKRILILYWLYLQVFRHINDDLENKNRLCPCKEKERILKYQRYFNSNAEIMNRIINGSNMNPK